MRGNNRDCNRALEIDLRRAQGLPESPKDALFLEEHLEICLDCRTADAALCVMDDDDTAGALPELDDLMRRRLVDDIIAKAEDHAFGSRDEFGDPGRTHTKPRVFRAVSLGAAIAAASIVAVFFWVNNSSSPGDSVSTQAVQTSALNQTDGTFILLAGEVLVGNQGAAIGHHLASGEQLRTGDGRAVVNLPTEITLSVGPATRLSYLQNEDSSLEVSLEEGRIQLSLSPGVERTGFSVVTEDGRIDVTGTIFSVTADEETVEVRVLRGEVEITGRQGGQRRLGTRAATTLGTDQVRTLSKAEEETLWKEVRTIELLDSEGNAVVDIESTPVGAAVSIDSVVLGRTPISAAVRSGYRELSLILNEEQVARKLVDIYSGSRLSWDFDLVEAENGAPGASVTPIPSSNRRVSAGVRDLSAQQLLLKAQSQRAERDWPGAAAAYQKLVTRFPDSAEARASLVSLGEIQLNKLGRPTAALAQFDKYLRAVKRGPLAQEALWGKGRALKSLGRQNEEKMALDLFITRFPKAIQAREVKARLADLENDHRR